MEAIEEHNVTPPDPDRVAARALVLAALSCRGLIENEKGSNPQGAENLRRQILPWLDRIGANSELEPAEVAVISTPVGSLSQRAAIDATWRSEGLVVLAWALHSAALPPIHTVCQPPEIANGLGFLKDREHTALAAPQLRSQQEIGYWAETYLTLHWRIRDYSLRPRIMDFVTFAANCQWTTMRLSELEVKDDELAIKGVRIDQVDQGTMQTVRSITNERRIALDWLLGFETLYSDVTTDT